MAQDDSEPRTADLSPFPPHGGRLVLRRPGTGRGSAGDAGSAPRNSQPRTPTPAARGAHFTPPPPPPPGTLKLADDFNSVTISLPRDASPPALLQARSTPGLLQSPLGSQARRHSPGSAPPAGRGEGLGGSEAGHCGRLSRPGEGVPSRPLPGRRRLYPPPGTGGRGQPGRSGGAAGRRLGPLHERRGGAEAPALFRRSRSVSGGLLKLGE